MWWRLAVQALCPWEMGLVNTVKAGEKLLVITQGYFARKIRSLGQSPGDRAGCAKRPAGERVKLADIEAKLQAGKYAAITLTHVDTSTGVLGQVAEVAALAKKI